MKTGNRPVYPRRSVSSGCGASTPLKPPRTAVSTGCGASASGGSKSSTRTGLSGRAKDQFDKVKGKKAKGNGGRTPVSTGCGASNPKKPATPAKLPKPTRTGC